MSTILNITGLWLGVCGVVLLFIFGMPYNIRGSANRINWITDKTNADIQKKEKLYDWLGIIGLIAILVGAILQTIGAILYPS